MLTVANVGRSLALTPKSRPDIAFVSHIPPMRPIPIPTTTRVNPWRSTSDSTLTARSECHPNADLVYPLADRIGHYAVDADRREQHGKAREDAEERHVEARASGGFHSHLLHRPDMRHRQPFARDAELALDVSTEWVGIRFGADCPGDRHVPIKKRRGAVG